MNGMNGHEWHGDKHPTDALERQLAQANAVIAEQKNSIAGLNSCIGGEDSCTTDNLIRVTRLENIIAEQKETIDSQWGMLQRGGYDELLAQIKDQSELIEKLKDALEENHYSSSTAVALGSYSYAMTAYDEWKENK